MINEENVKKALAENFPGMNFKHQFYGMLGYKHHAFGVTDDKIHVIHLSLFRLKPKKKFEIPISSITDISFEKGDIGNMQAALNIETQDTKYNIRTNKMIGYDPTAPAEEAFKFIFNKISK